MSGTGEPSTLPTTIKGVLSGIPAALVPSCLKALDRLIGASIDIPVAWLAQQRAKIDAQTESFKLVESAIGKVTASEVAADPEIIQRSAEVLLRKEYRKQINRDAVVIAAIEDLSASAEHSHEAPTESSEAPTESSEAPEANDESLQDEWLNVFERYAEDASSERMQKLWGRVLAGQIRCPGRFAIRTLRFLSEFSQSDALLFETFCKGSFGDGGLVQLVNPPDKKDIRELIYLEASGLIFGAMGLGFARTLTANEKGFFQLHEGSLVLVFKGTPNSTVTHQIVPLTPLGQELVAFLPGRDARVVARNVANAMRAPAFESAWLYSAHGSSLTLIETIWTSSSDKPLEGTSE